jgi:plastocyanin
MIKSSQLTSFIGCQLGSASLENMMRFTLSIAVLAALIVTTIPAAQAQEPLTITIRNHRFEPAELKVPAGKRVTIYIVNDDPTPEEFESHPLKVEKVIPGKSKGLVRIGPLAKGRYEFIGEFHQKTAKGAVIAE